MADEVLFTGAHPDATLPTPPLIAVGGDRRALDVSGVADRDRHVLVGDQIFDAQLARLVDDLRAPIVAVLLADLLQLVDDHLHQQAIAVEDGAQAFDGFQQLGELVEDFLALQAGEPLQLHVEDGLRLHQREAEVRGQAVARLGDGLRPANQLDHLVEVIERDLQSFEEVVAGFRLSQLEVGAAADDFAPEADEGLDELEQVQHLRPAADNREHDDAEIRLQLRVFVEIVEDDLGHLAAFQLDDNPHPLAIRFVAQIRDAVDDFFADQIRDPLEERLFVDLIRYFGDDDRDAVALLVGLDRRARAHLDRPASGGVRLEDAAAADDEPGGRKIGPGDQFDQLFELFAAGRGRLVAVGGTQVGVLDEPDAGIDHFAQVVRRHVGRHPDRNPGRSVHEQVRERRGKDGRLFGGLVVVGREVDGLLVEIRHHVVADRLQPRLGIQHRRGRIAVDGAEVPLAVDQGIAHVEFLRQPHERVVDGRVAVRVKISHHLADDLRALAIAARRRQAHRLHAV